jgi:bacillithiol biosynthesis cysteine-adding enzyme BshC
VREAIDVRRFPWIHSIVSAYAFDFASVASLYSGNPADAAEWPRTMARVAAAARNRDAISGILERQIDARGGPADARRAAGALRDPTSVAILTGQQAGLFGGPLYTLLKAISAIQVARRVTRDHGVPATAVFWVDGEDHDWNEVRGCRVLDRDLAIKHVALAALTHAGTHPTAALTLDAGINDAIAALAGALAPTEFTDALIADLTRRYRPGVGMAAAFASWIEHLLGHHGLVVFDSADGAAKPLVAGLFVQELSHPSRTATLAREAGERMGQLGHAPQIEPAEDSVALFYLDGRGRRALKRQGKDFAIGDEIRPAETVCREAASHPERFSPNVLLRPLVQDTLFPTVCYVGGPSEIAYHAQIGSLYHEFRVEAPLLYFRANATILDSAAMRFLEKYDLPLESLHAQDDSGLNALIERQLPPGVEQALHAAARDVQARLAEVKAAVPAIDPTLAGATDTTLDRMQESLKSLHGKIIQASKRKDETLRRQFTRTRALAFPGGEPQERALNVVFFLNRYGPTFCDQLLTVLPLDMHTHFLVTL